MKKPVGFYILHNPGTDETYIGSGVLGDRESVHKRTLENGTHHNYRLQQAYKKNPNFEFLGVPVDIPGNTVEENRAIALQIEQGLIDENKGNPLLLNLVENVEKPRLGVIDSEETKAKKRASHQQRWEKLPEDVKQKIQEELSTRMANNTYAAGRVKSEEEVAKWRESRGDYQHSEDVKKRIGASNSVALKGRTLEPEHKEKVVAPLLASNEKRQQKVQIDGVVYDSINDAARTLGLNPGTVYHRINSANPLFVAWCFV